MEDSQAVAVRRATQARLQALEVLLGAARDPVMTASARLPGVETRLMPIALYLRLLSSVDAAMVLARAGHGREAFVLSRTTAEVTIDLLWSQTSPDVDDLALGYARWRIELWRRAARSAPHVLGPPRPDGLAAEEIAGHRDAYGPWGQRGWTARDIDDRVADVKADGRFDPGMVDDVQLLRRMADTEVHPDVQSMARRLRWRDGHLEANLEPEAVHGPLALGALLLHVALGAQAMHELLEMPMGPLERAWAEGQEIIARAPVDGPGEAVT